MSNTLHMEKRLSARLAFPLAAALSLLFLLWRARYGYCFLDEPFIISLAQRLFQGDALIVDEWHVAQTSGSLLLPFYAVFHLFSVSNEGIMLCFRYVYCLLWWLCCIVIYKSLAFEKNSTTAFLVFLYLILFSPLDYMTLSYTSFGVAACLLLCCFMCRTPYTQQKLSLGRVCLFSVLWIVLALCSPLMALFYIAFFLFMIVGAWFEKKKSEFFYFRNLRAVCFASLPLIAVVCAMYLYFFVFSRAGFSQLLQSLPYVLNDPQHEKRNVLKAILSTPGYVAMYAPVFVLVSFAVFALAMWKNCRKYRLGLFSLCAILYIGAQLSYTKSVLPGHEPAVPLLNQQMMLIGILGMPAFALLEKRPYKSFLVFQCMGWFYALMQNFSSNTRIMTIAMSLTVIGVSGIGCCVLLAKESWAEYKDRQLLRKSALLLVCLVLTVQIGSELCTRLYRTYYDGTFSTLTEEIRYGSAKGLMTTQENAELHNRLYENMDYLLSSVATEGKSFMSTTEMPHIYLDANMDYGVFSSWNCHLGRDVLSARIDDYLALNPDNTPDIVFSGSENDILPFTDEGYTRLEYRGSYLFVKN